MSTSLFVCSDTRKLVALIAMSSLKDRIKEARAARDNPSQEDVAAEVRRRYPNSRFTQQNLAALETGASKATAYIAELAEVLEVNTDWLALDRGPRDRNTKGYYVDNPRLVAALKTMEPMPDETRDQAIKILDTLAQPGRSQPRDKKAGNS